MCFCNDNNYNLQVIDFVSKSVQLCIARCTLCSIGMVVSALSMLISDGRTHDHLLSCLPIALHHLEVFVKFRLMGASGPVEFAPLSEKRAAEIGAEIISEFFVYGTAASIILYEYWKSVQRGQEKDESQDQKIRKLDFKLKELETEVQKLHKQLTVQKGRTDPSQGVPMAQVKS